MHARRVRVEFIRFSLLVILTVGLVSVAVRYNDSSESGNRATARPSTSASLPGSATPSAGATSSPAETPSPSETGSASGSGGGTGTATGSGSGAGTGTAAGAGGGSDEGVATLPRTGPSRAAPLAALALLCIGWGGLSMAVAGRRRPQRVTQVR